LAECLRRYEYGHCRRSTPTYRRRTRSPNTNTSFAAIGRARAGCAGCSAPTNIHRSDLLSPPSITRAPTAACGAQGPLNTGAATRCGPAGHAGRVGAGISQAKHERSCAEPSEIPSDATAILLVSPAVMPLEILFFERDLTVEQPCGRPEINQCYPIWEY
jgi:hypothetical protein